MPDTMISKASIESLEGSHAAAAKVASSGGFKKERNYANGNNNNGGKFKNENSGPRPPVTGPMAKAIRVKQAEVDANNAEIKQLEIELKKLNENSVAKLSPEKEARQEELNQLHLKKKAAFENKENLYKVTAEIRAALFAEREKSNKKARDIKSPDSIAREIDELEKKIESASFSVNEEKKLIQEISKLKKAKRAVEETLRNPAADPAKALEEKAKEAEMNLSVARQECNKLDSLWKSTQAERDALKEERQKSSASNKLMFSKKDETRNKLNELRGLRETLRKDLNNLYEENRKKNAEKQKVNRVFGEIRGIEDEIRKVVGQKSKIHHPLSEEKDSAQAVIKYIKQKLSIDDSAAAAASAKPEGLLNIRKVDDAVSKLPKGVKTATVFKKGNLAEEEGFYTAMKKSSSKTSSGTKEISASAPLKLEFQIVAAFGKIGVPVPVTFGDLEGSLKVAQVKAAEYEKKSIQIKADLESQSAAFDEKIADLEKKKAEKQAEFDELKKTLKTSSSDDE